MARGRDASRRGDGHEADLLLAPWSRTSWGAAQDWLYVGGRSAAEEGFLARPWEAWWWSWGAQVRRERRAELL